MYFNEENFDSGLKYLKGLEFEDDYACLIFVAEASSSIVLDIQTALGSGQTSYAGGIFPSIIAEGEVKASGFIVTVLPVLMPPITLNLSSLNESDKQIQLLNQQMMACPYKPLLMVMSATSTEQFSLQNHLVTYLRGSLSNQASFIGGSSGSGTLERTFSIFDKTGIYDNAAIIMAIDKPSAASANVGLFPLGRANIVTDTNFNSTIINSVNNIEAASWYIKQYKKLKGENIVWSDIHYTSNLHVAFFSLTGGHIVRGVTGVSPEGGLELAGTIPLHSSITLVDARPHIADRNIKQIVGNLKSEVPTFRNSFVVQCATRPAIMGDSFSSQLQFIEESVSIDDSTGAVGFIALGEFSMMDKANHVDFLNVSVVLAVTE